MMHPRDQERMVFMAFAIFCIVIFAIFFWSNARDSHPPVDNPGRYPSGYKIP